MEILGSSPRMTRNLEFLEIVSVALLPRNDAENSRIPKLEFPKPCVIPRLDWGISSQINLEFPNLEFPSPKTHARSQLAQDHLSEALLASAPHHGYHLSQTAHRPALLYHLRVRLCLPLPQHLPC